MPDTSSGAPSVALEINKVLSVSSTHITQSDSEALSESAAGNDGAGFLCTASADCTQIFVLVDAESYEGGDEDMKENAGYSDEFMALVELARDNGCQWLRVHADGPQVDGLPTFVW